MFIDIEVLRARVAAMLHKVAADTDVSATSRWQPILQSALTSAYNDILAHWLRLGYTPAQVDGWFRGPEFQEDIALYWAFVKGAALHAADDRWIARLDRRPDLLRETLLDALGGEATLPAEAGPVGYGEVQTHRLDHFTDDQGYWLKD